MARPILKVARKMIHGKMEEAKQLTNVYAEVLHDIYRRDRKFIYSLVFTGAIAAGVWWETRNIQNPEVQLHIREISQKPAVELFTEFFKAVEIDRDLKQKQDK